MATKPVTLTDRLLIEWTVWTVDTYVQSLPGRSRRAVRRELRANLRASAAELGRAEAIRRLGGLRRLSREYLDAEYGHDGPRPQLLRGMFWAFTIEAVILVTLISGFESFLAGVESAGQPDPGTYSWNSLSLLGLSGDVSYDATGLSEFNFKFSGLALLYMVAGFILGSRLWRLVPAWLRRIRGHRVPTTG
jgi:hypothetical protein